MKPTKTITFTMLLFFLLLVWFRGAHAPAASYCGDGTCDSGENCSTCPEDCGECSGSDGDDSSGSASYCGDGTCDSGENCSTCPEDCGECSGSDGDDSSGSASYCGDGTCDSGENCSTCPEDCGECETPSPSPTPQTCEPSCYCSGNTLVCVNEDCSTDTKECEYGCKDGACIEDTQAPITSASVDSGRWYASPVLVMLNCNDSQSGCKYTFYCVDTANVCEPDKKGDSVTIECAADSICIYYLRYYSVDYLGNEEQVKSAKVQIDNKAPEVRYTGDSGQVTGKATVSFSCEDEGSGCSAIKYRLDNENWRSYNDEFTVSSEGYHNVQFFAKDNVGNESEMQQESFIVINPLETLEIYNVRVTDVTSSTAKIVFETSVEANVEVLYGKSKSLELSKEGAYGTTHAVLLENLEPATKYYFRVRAWNEKKTVESELKEFTTMYENFKIMNVKVEAFSNYAKISWETSIDASCTLYYGKTNAFEQGTAQSSGKLHEVTLQNLEPNTKYYFKIEAISVAQRVEHTSNFITAELPAKPQIMEIMVEPSNHVAPEGSLVIFTALIANVSKASYEWQFGDGEKETGIIEENSSKGTGTKQISAMHVYYLGDEDKKQFEVKLILKDANGIIDEKSTQVLVVRAYIKARILEPKGINKKTEPVMLKIQLMDKQNRPLDASDVLYLEAYAKGRRLNLQEEAQGVFKAEFDPKLRVSNNEFVLIKTAAPIEGAIRELTSRLVLNFEPLELKTKNPFVGQQLYMGSKLGMYRFDFELYGDAKARDLYLQAKLVSRDWEKTLEVITDEKIPYAAYVDINHMIDEHDAENGLMLLLSGHDAYGNELKATIEIPISKSNPAFDMEVLEPKDREIALLEEKEVVVRIKSNEGLKGVIELNCGLIKGEMNYNELVDRHYFTLKLPADYEERELHCKLTAKALGAEAMDIEKLDFNIISGLKITFIKPKEPEQASAELIDEIEVRIEYSNGQLLEAESIEGELIVDGKAENIVLEKKGEVYSAKLAEPLDFGEHVLEFKMREPLKSEKLVYVKINHALKLQEILLGLALVFAVVVLIYIFLIISLKIKDAKSRIMNQRNKLLTLRKKLKAEYFKRHITEAEFKARYEELNRKLREVEKKIKDKQYLLFWKK